MKDIIFWNVDTQKDFIRTLDHDPALEIPGAEDILETLGELTRFARRNGFLVVNTRDWHSLEDEEISDNPDFIETFPPHCIAGTVGAEFVEETNPNYGPVHIVENSYISKDIDLKAFSNIIINKNKFDVFAGNMHADSVVSSLDPMSVVVYGVASNVCVHHAVMGLADRVEQVVVISDAIKGFEENKEDVWISAGVAMITFDQLKEFFE